MVADFEKNAAAYDAICDSWAETRNKSPINRCVVQFAALLEKGCHVLDIGCGTGFPIDAYLSGQGFSVTGIDVSARMLEKARKLNLKNARFFPGVSSSVQSIPPPMDIPFTVLDSIPEA